MSKYVLTLICAILFLQSMSIVSAQAQVPPPNYSLNCNFQRAIEVDPETVLPPTETAECSIYNEESYSIELSLQINAGAIDASLSVDEITVGASQEEIFEVSLEAEDGMLMGAYQIVTTSEVTKTGELEYSDDDPMESKGLVQIMQYASFRVEPQQSEKDYSLANGESFELVYTISNTGNHIDRFGIELDSSTYRICDTEREVENVHYYSECDGGYKVPPISNDCKEELDIKLNGDNAAATFEIDNEQSVDFYFTVSGLITNSSCWPVDSNGNLALSFDMTFTTSSAFHNMYERSGELQESDGSRYYSRYSVDVRFSDDKNIIASTIPGFETPYLLFCILFVVVIHNRKSPLY